MSNFDSDENTGTDWKQTILNDLRVLTNEVYPGIDENQSFLDKQKTFEEDDPKRNIAPLARRVDRFVREVGILSVAPWLDVEYADKEGLDNSLSIEAFHDQLGNRMGLTKRVSAAHRICVYAPWAFLKVALPGTVSWQRGFDDVADVADPARDGGSPDEGGPVRLDEVPPGNEPELNLEEVAQITPEVMAKVEINDLPTMTNMDTPRVEAVDPRHVVTDPYVGSLEEAYYIAHLVLRTPAQAARAYGKEKGFYKQVTRVQGSGGFSVHGIKLDAFRPMTNQDLVILAEVYVRQDPSRPEDTGMFGVMDFSSGEWVLPLTKLDVPNRWIAIRADTTHPMAWYGPSYIDQAYDDMADAAFVRQSVRDHISWNAMDALWLPKSVEVDPETLAEIESGTFSRRTVRYSGPKFDPTKSHLRSIPVGLLQYDQIVNDSFARNTGATETSQGNGSSNKVATAFNQEQAFMAKRTQDIMNKLYDAYIDSIMIATWLLLNYGSSKFTINANGISFTMNRDMVAGITNHSVNAINRSAQDPLSAKLMMVQQLKEIFGNEQLSQFFALDEVAKLIAGLNGWPSRVLASPAEAAPSQIGGPGSPGGGAENPSQSGTSGSLGDGVDSAASGGQDVEAAVAGATNRNT